MKSFLISIRPKWCAKILNGEKTLEIRRNAQKEWVDYLSGKTKEKPKPMTGYIYCTQGKPYVAYVGGELYTQSDGTGRGSADICFNGKVIAKFTLMEVEKISYSYLVNTRSYSITSCLTSRHFEEKCCLKQWELDDYLKGKNGYAWHISDLVIFDKPKELDQFEYPNPSGIRNVGQRSLNGRKSKKHPPESWCYVEELK